LRVSNPCFFFSSRRRHTRWPRDWSSDVCSSDLSAFYCLYVSPLKALANDINRNLEEPLRELTELSRKEGKPEPLVRVGVRSGDRSEERRVGKEWRCGWAAYQLKKKCT